MKLTMIFLLYFIFCITGCGLFNRLEPAPIKKHWGAMGGSRADATIKVGYEYRSHERARTIVDDAEAERIATERCKAWGYIAVSPFDTVETCLERSAAGQCFNYRVTREYQCLGEGNIIKK